MGTRTYAVSWQEGNDHVIAGKLALRPTHLRLEGRCSGGKEVFRAFHYGDLGEIWAERPNGHREIVITWYGRRISVSVIDGAGAFGELLGELRHRAQEASAAAHLRECQNVV